MHPDPRKFAPVIIFLGLTAAAVYYLITVSSTQATGPLSASGTVEAVELSLAPEINGRVLEVLVNQGDIHHEQKNSHEGGFGYLEPGNRVPTRYG